MTNQALNAPLLTVSILSPCTTHAVATAACSCNDWLISNGNIAFSILLQVESIVISIIAMLSSPNDESPANVDAAKQWREDKDGFRKKVARIVRKSQENFD
jgi:ubiquitin-protein ligase